jgi:tetratricopeptide (TPR) repeat protein
MGGDSSHTKSTWFEHPWVPEFVACGITALTYLASLSFGFVYDDVPQILKNPAIQSWRYLPQYFTSHVWAAIYPNSTGNYYRPLFLLWLRLNYLVFGTDPFGWHATSVLCHVVATYLVFRVVEQLTRDRWIAFAAAVIFGVHPAHIENVAWISGVTDPLMACFVLASCSAFLRLRESRKAWALLLSLALFVLALLSKETAAVVPALIFSLAYPLKERARTREIEIVSGDTRHSKTLHALLESMPYLLLDVLYVAIRYRALGGFAHATISISWKEVWLTWPAVLWFYAQHLLFPVRLSEFYPLDYVRHAATGAVMLPLVLLLALALALYFWIRRLPQKQVGCFALSLIIFPLLPVLDLRSLTAGDIVHDRYLYLPAAGFALLVAISMSALAERLPDRYRLLVPGTFTAAVVLLFASLTVSQQAQWANDMALYTCGLESAPGNLTVRDNLANTLMAANHPDRAIPLYLDVLRQNPNFWRSNYNLGYAYYKTGNYSSAEDSLQRAIRIDRSDSDQFIYLALVQLQIKKLTQAADNAHTAIAKNPQARGYHFILGLIEEAKGDREAAIAALKTELTLYPNNAPAAAELQKIEGNTSNPQSDTTPK